MADGIKVTGLTQFSRDLKKLESGLPKAMRLAVSDVSSLVVMDALPRIPSRTGRAKASLITKTSGTQSRIAGGGSKAPHYPWLDFGGQGSKAGRPPARPYISEGRYLYAAFYKEQGKFDQILSDALTRAAESAGFEVT